MTAPTPTPALRHLQMELVAVCNLRCPLCTMATGSSPGRNFMPLAEVRALLEGLEAVPERVSLYGTVGEPLLHPDLPGVVAAARSASPGRIRISTNGLLLVGRLVDDLLDSPPDTLMVALDGATQETYGAYRVGGDLAVLCRNMEHLATRRAVLGRKLPRLVAQVIPSAQNEAELPAIEALARRLGFDALRIKRSASVASSPGRRPSREDLTPDGAPASALRHPPCEADELYVDTEGGLHPCCHWAASASRGGGAMLLGGVPRDGRLARPWAELAAAQPLSRLRASLPGEAPHLCRAKCVEGSTKAVETRRLVP